MVFGFECAFLEEKVTLGLVKDAESGVKFQSVRRVDWPIFCRRTRKKAPSVRIFLQNSPVARETVVMLVPDAYIFSKSNHARHFSVRSYF
jgi:hypothetical protein